VTEAADTADALRLNEEQLRLMIEHAPIGMMLTALDGTFIRVNDRFCEIVGRERHEVLGVNFREITHPDDLAADDELFQRLQAGEIPRYELEKRYLLRDGSVVHCLIAVSLMRDVHRTPLYVVVQAIDVTERKRAEQLLEQHTEHLRALSLLDELSGLYNRRGFLALAQQQFANARRLGKKVVLLFVDMDGLKPINDRFGHEAGDRALSSLAALLRSTFRESDVIGRLGGDEFAVAAIEVSPPGSTAVQRRLEEALTVHNQNRTDPWELSFSVGTAEFDPEHPRTLFELMQDADERMYANKRERKAARLAG
jgi:diguanylate cyclase (GGDEF)-like protein/PAS domain S-box-containing protein